MCALEHNLISSTGVFFRATERSAVPVGAVDDRLFFRVFERRTSIRSEAYSILICLYATKCEPLSVFPLEETICPAKSVPKNSKCPLLVGVCHSKTAVM